ncbi:MAG TPA: hypothetical protein VJA23_05665 [Candidatus Nanoarchaeia archaeon]|nr:hypothetical protein [Candidatus Nanoarchaeia archaeon]
MGTRDITREYPLEFANEKGEKIHRAWELGVQGDILILERYGSMCGWSELRLKKGSVTVYKITKPWSTERRTEHFFDQPIRTYDGDQFSFVEYISVIAEQERVLSAPEYVQAGLDMEVEKQYRDYFQRIMDTKA